LQGLLVQHFGLPFYAAADYGCSTYPHLPAKNQRQPSADRATVDIVLGKSVEEKYLVFGLYIILPENTPFRSRSRVVFPPGYARSDLQSSSPMTA
jgi:hypothetical protein